MAAASIQCALCGRRGRGSYRRSSTGESFCASHPWCPHCRTAHLTLSVRRAATDRRVGAATLQARAAQVLRDLRALQIDLPNVPLSLVPTMPGPEEGRCFKSFGGRVHDRGRLGSRSKRVWVPLGSATSSRTNTPTPCCTSTAGPSVDPYVEEGVCELVAVVWLTNRGTRQEVLNDVWANPHPAYGEQMRRLVRLGRRDGVRRVLDGCSRTGQPE